MTEKRSKRLGIDVGGTYTDLVFFDEETKDMRMAKTPSTPGNLVEGVINGIIALDLDLATVQLVVHGTTMGVNTVIQKNGAKTGLLTTAGFEDVLEIGTMSKPEMYNLFYRKPRPLVSREHRLGISERMTFEGEVLVAVDAENVRTQVKKLIDAGVTAVAVATLHAYANPENENAIARVLKEEFPDLNVSVSHEISNQRREFERTSTAVLNAYIAPPAKEYFEHLRSELYARGFDGAVFIMKSNGGVMEVLTASRTPVHTLLSGPVAGSIAGKTLSAVTAKPNVITFDMGGTSCDISVILDGEPEAAFESLVEGYPIMTQMVRINYLGSGGGSIAKIIGERSLRVGPESAGADPGPACYNQGGEQPTVTDANLILGRLDPQGALAGGIALDTDMAAAAIKTHIADQLEMSVKDAALGIVEIACVKMAYAIREVTVEQGLDPRDFTLISFGGAGPMHTPFIASMVGIRQVIVPWSPGTLCGWGMLNTDLRHDVAQVVDYGGRQLDQSELVDMFARLESQGKSALIDQGVDATHLLTNRAIDMRYKGQEHTLTIPLESGPIDDDTLANLRLLFNQTHERRYAHASPDEPVEFVNIRVEAVGELDKPGLFTPTAGLAEEVGDAVETRQVTFRQGELPTAIYRRAQLEPGTKIDGPAIVTEIGSTTLVPPEFRLSVDDYGNLIIDVPEAGSG